MVLAVAAPLGLLGALLVDRWLVAVVPLPHSGAAVDAATLLAGLAGLAERSSPPPSRSVGSSPHPCSTSSSAAGARGPLWPGPWGSTRRRSPSRRWACTSSGAGTTTPWPSSPPACSRSGGAARRPAPPAGGAGRGAPHQRERTRGLVPRVPQRRPPPGRRPARRPADRGHHARRLRRDHVDHLEGRALRPRSGRGGRGDGPAPGPPQPAQLLELARRADPDGRWAMAAGQLRRAGATPVLAVDTTRLAAVTSGTRRGPAPARRRSRRPCGHPRSRDWRATASRCRRPHSPRPAARPCASSLFWSGRTARGSRRTLGRLTAGTRTYTVPLTDCARTCRLLALAVRGEGLGNAYSGGSLVVSRITDGAGPSPCPAHHAGGVAGGAPRGRDRQRQR